MGKRQVPAVLKRPTRFTQHKSGWRTSGVDELEGAARCVHRCADRNAAGRRRCRKHTFHHPGARLRPREPTTPARPEPRPLRHLFVFLPITPHHSACSSTEQVPVFEKLAHARNVRLVGLDQEVVDAGLLELIFGVRRVQAAEPAADHERAACLRLTGPDKADAVETVLRRVTQLQHSAIVLLSQPLQGRYCPGIMQVTENDHQHPVGETRSQLDQPGPQRRRLVVAKRPQAVQPLEHLVSRQARPHVEICGPPRPEARPG